MSRCLLAILLGLAFAVTADAFLGPAPALQASTKNAQPKPGGLRYRGVAVVNMARGSPGIVNDNYIDPYVVLGVPKQVRSPHIPVGQSRSQAPETPFHQPEWWFCCVAMCAAASHPALTLHLTL